MAAGSTNAKSGKVITKHDIVDLSELSAVTKALDALAPAPGIEARVKALEDARGDPPPKHAASHAAGGSDSVTPVAIGAADRDHTHSVAEISSGVLSVNKGGTGQSTEPSLLVNLASSAATGIFKAAPRPGVTGVLSVANGGTGATTAEAARKALGIGESEGAPMPKSGSTGNAVGRWIARYYSPGGITNPNPTTGILPDGGTWAYVTFSASLPTPSDGENEYVALTSGAGVVAGGTQIIFSSSQAGFAWRIA